MDPEPGTSIRTNDETAAEQTGEESGAPVARDDDYLFQLYA